MQPAPRSRQRAVQDRRRLQSLRRSPRRARTASACPRGWAPRAASSARRRTRPTTSTPARPRPACPSTTARRLGMCGPQAAMPADGRSDERGDPAARQSRDRPDAARAATSGPNLHLHVRHLGLRADAARRAAAALGRHAALSRHLPERHLVRRRHLGLRLHQAADDQSGAERRAQLRLLLRRQRPADQLSAGPERQHHRHRRLEPVLDHLQHRHGDLRLGDDGERLHRPGGPVRPVGAVGLDAGLDQRRGGAHRVRPGRQDRRRRRR